MEAAIAEMGTPKIESTRAEVVLAPGVKRKLIIYLLVTAITFAILVVPQRAGVTVPIFVIIQGIILYRMIPSRKIFIGLAPIFVLALNAFISDNTIWQGANIVVGLVLFALMAVWIAYGVDIMEPSLQVFEDLLIFLFTPLTTFVLPLRWFSEKQQESMSVVRRVLVALVIAVPVLFFLLQMLSQADLIFAATLRGVFDSILSVASLRAMWRIMAGVVAGLSLFGMMYCVFASQSAGDIDAAIVREKLKLNGDTLIIGIVLGMILAVYTVFVSIQFRYLFAQPDQLPYGLTFVTYARQGFFELLFLSFVNIGIILLVVWLTSHQGNTGAKVAKYFCMYLCAVTMVLLVSSFYRMALYSGDDGLTRMRFFVFGFLIFQTFGLVATFVYIAKPVFNVVLVYGLIGLVYFMLLNMVPVDRFIARDQVNRYFATGTGGIAYAASLSADAAVEIARLWESDNPDTHQHARGYFRRIENRRSGVMQWNLSHHLALRR